jgi:hypothetical protein
VKWNFPAERVFPWQKTQRWQVTATLFLVHQIYLTTLLAGFSLESVALPTIQEVQTQGHEFICVLLFEKEIGKR